MSKRFYKDDGDATESIDISSIGDWADEVDNVLDAHREILLKHNTLIENHITAISGLCDQLKDITLIIKQLAESQKSTSEHCANLALSVMELREDNVKLRAEISSLKESIGGADDAE